MEETNDSMKERYPHLSKIDSPDDLKWLNEEEINALASEIRAFLVEKVTKNGGHLASNLGVVELTLAIHRVFDAPKDHIIFDVGHQSYVHKILTGRKDRFDLLRKPGGLSGFPKRSESVYDSFGTGHSSTSLSAALGFAQADKMQGDDAWTVCVVGDGAYTGGMIHEALNNVERKLRLLIILNENEMSISKNIGCFARVLSRLRLTKGYFKTKNATSSFVLHIPFIGKALHRKIVRWKMNFKGALYGSNYFENLGLTYFGPVNGNDEDALERLLAEAKRTGQSCVVHVKTKKGKGYLPAEETPDLYHGMAPACKRISSEPTFSQIMGNRLSDEAGKDPRICAITAAMTLGTGLTAFRKKHPERFFDVGIAEEHAVTFAAGLAAEGMKPYVAVYSTFLQRAYDNILHDVALQKLPVVFCIDRAGLNACDGATHHGIFDVSFLSSVPEMVIYTPLTKDALERAVHQSLHASGPVAIRYPNGCENPEIVAAFYGENTLRNGSVYADYGNAEKLDAVIVTDGKIVTEALKAKKELANAGKTVGILLLEQIKPYAEIARSVALMLPEKPCKVLFLEEEIKAGGMGMMLSDALEKESVFQNKTKLIFATDDCFAEQTKKEPIYRTAGIDCASICKAL